MNRCIQVGEQQTASLMTTKRQVLSRYRTLEKFNNEIKRLQREEPCPEYIKQPFNMNELQEALDDLKPNKSPGPDQITNDMIKQLGKNAKTAKLDIINFSWKTGHVPQILRETNMIPIHKKARINSRQAATDP